MATGRALAANLASGMTSNLVRVALQIVLLPLMARELGPSEMGLYALALPMVNFVLLLSDAGLGDSLAKERSDDDLVWSSAFWGLLITGALAAMSVYGASFFVAAAAEQPRLPQVVLPLCLTLLMVAATVVPTARMLRRGTTVPVSAGDMIGNIVGGALAISLALSGFGVWAMVAQFVAIYATRMIVCNIAEPFLPKACFSFASLLSHTGMGGQILGGRLIELATSMFERSQISRGLGTAAVGGYANANQIGFFASNAVGSPLWANLYYVAITRPKEEVLRHYVRSHRIFAIIVFPAATLLAMAMPTVVPIFFGEAWRSNIGAIIVMVLACPWGNLAVLYSAIFYAQNRGRFVLYLQAGTSALRIASVLALWPYGVLPVIGALAASNIVYYLVTVFILSPHVGNSRRDLVRAVAGPFLASAAMALAMRWTLPAEPTLFHVVMSACPSLLVYAGTMLVVDLDQTRSDLRTLLSVINRRTASA
jgi:O-antigen/teichoic acid export membrane protein